MSAMGESKFWWFLERRAPWLGTPGVLKAVVLLNALTFILLRLDPSYEDALQLIPEKILQGEVWRLVTYIFIPETQSTFWIIFALLFLWFLSSALEDGWGALRLNVFYLVGMLGCTAAAFFFGGGASNTFLNLSLFFAFATVAPNYEVYLFFIIRVKMKYIAWVMAGVFALQFLASPLGVKMAMLASLANYLIFFGPGFLRDLRSQRQSAVRREKFREELAESLHRCATCGRTETSDPDLDFRVTAVGTEYCLEHLPRG
ncbi:MAG: rhomboid family intramembrane serine protease [Chthoniobacterales bacterium]